MPDLSAFAAVRSSMQIAGDIAQALIALRDGQMIQSKVIELQSAILAAQSNAMKAQSEQATLLESVSRLEKEIAELKSWDSEKEKYELRRRPSGALTYAPKKTAELAEPEHELCAQCYARGFKRILQTEHWQPMRCEVLCCHECGSVVYAVGNPHPEHAKLRPRPQR